MYYKWLMFTTLLCFARMLNKTISLIKLVVVLFCGLSFIKCSLIKWASWLLPRFTTMELPLNKNAEKMGGLKLIIGICLQSLKITIPSRMIKI